MLTFSNANAHAIVSNNLGEEVGNEARELVSDFLPFSELDAALKEEVQWIRGSKTIPESVVNSGWVYEVETRRVRRVV